MSPIPDAPRFDGRVIVVTGAGRGLGRAYAAHLAAHGAIVIVNDVDAAPAEEAARSMPGAIACVADVSRPDGAQRVIDAACAAAGRFDAVVANAGASWHVPFGEAGVADLDAALAANLHTTWNVVHAAWSHFVGQGGGRIVTTASGAVFGFAGRAHYAAAKGAVLALTRTFAVEGAAHGIVANCVLPWGATRLAREGSEAPDPALAAPAVARLCHESCTDTGETFTVGGGRVGHVTLAPTRGPR